MSDCLLKMKKLCADPRTNVQMIDIDVGHGSDIGMGFSEKMLSNVRPALQNPREMEGFYKVGASEDSEERERERERERVETNGHRGEVHSVREVTSVHSDKELKWNSCIEMETISHSERQRRRSSSSSSSRGRGDKKKIARRLPRDLS